MKLMQLSAHWSPEEAYSMLMMLDELRDCIWNNYREEIIAFAQESCRQESMQEHPSVTEFDDDIPF